MLPACFSFARHLMQHGYRRVYNLSKVGTVGILPFAFDKHDKIAKHLLAGLNGRRQHTRPAVAGTGHHGAFNSRVQLTDHP